MNWNKKLIRNSIIGVLFVLGIIFLIMNNGNIFNSKNVLNKMKFIGNSGDEILIRVGDIYQKINLYSGDISQPNAIERRDISHFNGLPDKADKEFYENFSIVYSENKNNIIIASFVGSEENKNKRKEFKCTISKNICEKSDVLFRDYMIGDLKIMSDSIWWLGWNSKNSTLIGITNNDVSIGTLYVCNTKNGVCNKSQKDGLNFPNGSINKSLDKIIAIEQNDIANEKIGDKWKLFVYDVDNLKEPLKSFDISKAISKDEDLIYDGINSIAWRDSGAEDILIGTTRGIFKLNLNSGKLENIFVDISRGEDDLYWNSDSLKFSDSGRYAIFTDATEVKLSEGGKNIENEETILKSIDLIENNKITELLQAEELSIK